MCSDSTLVAAPGRKVMVKPDLRRSLNFLARDRAQARLRPCYYVHQSPALLEQNRRKAADKRYCGIISARMKMDKIRTALDMVSRDPSIHTIKKGQGSATSLSNRHSLSDLAPIPGFKYHGNGDEKEQKLKVAGSREQLSGTDAYAKWKEGNSALIIEEHGIETEAEGSHDVDLDPTALAILGLVDHSVDSKGAFRRTKARPNELLVPGGNRRSIVMKQGRSSFPSDAIGGTGRRHRQHEKGGKQGVTFALDYYGDKIRHRQSEVMLTVLKSALSDSPDRDEYQTTQEFLKMKKELGRKAAPFYDNNSDPGKSEIEVFKDLQVRRDRETDEKIHDFLQDVKRSVRRSNSKSPNDPLSEEQPTKREFMFSY